MATGALTFVGVTAVAGGAEMILFPHGNVFGLAGWILIEIVLIPERSAIEALYAAIAGGLLVLCAMPSFRAALRVR